MRGVGLPQREACVARSDRAARIGAPGGIVGASITARSGLKDRRVDGSRSAGPVAEQRMSSLAEMPRPAAETRSEDAGRLAQPDLAGRAFLRGPVRPELIRDEVLPEIFLASARA